MAATSRSSPRGFSTTRKFSHPAAEQRARAGRTNRRADHGRCARSQALPGRRRHLRLVRRSSPAFRQPSRCALRACSAPRHGSAACRSTCPIAFGVEVGSGRSLSSRLASALVAAEEAAHDGLKWKYYDPESFADASWRLSMLSQLDEAIDRGEVWVAYQPKLDLNTRRIIGAEALARWTHPEKGPIAATEFVAAAEKQQPHRQADRFRPRKGDRRRRPAQSHGGDFDMAVNLSARLSDRKKPDAPSVGLARATWPRTAAI